MTKPSPSAGTSSTCGGRETKFKGVRRRKWGKWVSEVRLPNSRERIWLGSYDSPEKAARAFDAAAFCLRGRRAGLNFPDDVPDVPGPRLSHQQIQAAAARHAHSYAASDPASVSEPPAAASPPSSDGPAVEDLTAMDWSFLDLMADATADFGYGFFPPTAANSDAAAAEDGGGNLSLWNF